MARRRDRDAERRDEVLATLVADRFAGAYPHSMKAPPYQDGRQPISSRTGKPQALSTCQADYAADIDGVPVRSEGLSGGLWDHEQEARMGPRKGQERPQRHDAADMAAYVERFSARLTAHELDVYHLFWLRRLSYAEAGRETSTSRERVYECIKRLRRKMHGWLQGPDVKPPRGPE